MRHQLLKLTRKKSTKAERVFSEMLKSHRIPFRTKVKIGNREIDFLIKEKFVIEIDGHDQDGDKNYSLIALGYVPIHILNQDIINNREEIIKKLCL